MMRSYWMGMMVSVGIMGSLWGTAAQAQEPVKKLIASGWDNPTPKQLRRDLAEMERQPFDGVVLEVRIPEPQPQIGANPFRRAFENTQWDRRWFADPLTDLQSLRPTRLKYNFVNFLANPGGMDWFDDAAWANIVDHWRIAAWFARAGNLRGILFDPERYTQPFRETSQFMYDAQPQRAQHRFEDYQDQARRRGREVMQAVCEEYPDITILTYFIYGWLVHNNEADPQAQLEVNDYGLLPAFIEGMLAVAPPGVTIVDGTEAAYTYNSLSQFQTAAIRLKTLGQRFVAAELRAKFRAQIQIGFGLYVDGYNLPETSNYFIDGKGGPRVLRLQDNLQSALATADEYVWLWGERGRWWPDPTDTVPWDRKTIYPPWEEALPGSGLAVALARDPLGVILGRYRAALPAGLANRARNSSFSETSAPGNEGAASDWETGGAPAGWNTWQEDSSTGRFTWDREVGNAAPGSARLAGVRGGCFIQSFKVQPGERYLVTATCRQVGAGGVWGALRWRTAAGKWMPSSLADAILEVEPAAGNAGRWRQMAASTIVPDGAGEMVLLLGATAQRSESDVAWFDDVQVLSP